MNEPHDELRELTTILHDLVAWDAEDDLPGYPEPPPLAPQPAAPPVEARAPARPEPPARRPPPARPEPAVPPTPQRFVPQVDPPGPKATDEEQPTLEAIQAQLGDCHRCKLCVEGRKNIVFGEGNPNADLLFAGEGPGFHEDRLGRPFVGKAGELLDKMIAAMGLRREDTYICNVVKCRPPKNRDPEPEEVLACQPFLHAQVRAIRPKVVVTLGRFASQCLLNTPDRISRLRGQFYPYFDAKLMPTFHPAYLLRNPADKRLAWEDLQKVMAELGLTR